MAPPTRKEKELHSEIIDLRIHVTALVDENASLSAAVASQKTHIDAQDESHKISVSLQIRTDRYLRQIMSAVGSDAVMRTLGMATQQSGNDPGEMEMYLRFPR